jgi:hypothetical protein
VQRVNQSPILTEFELVNFLNIKRDVYLGLGEASLKKPEID